MKQGNTGEKRGRRFLKPGTETQFKPGVSGNPAGRPKGSRTVLSEAFLADICAHWREHGRSAIEKVYHKDPSTYLRVVAALQPKEVHADITTSHEERVTILTAKLAALDAEREAARLA